MTSDFFDNHQGNPATSFMDPEHRRRGVRKDLIADVQLRFDRRWRSLVRQAAALPRQRVLVVGVEVPERGDALAGITAQLARSRHDVVVSTVPMAPKGKFENVDDAIRAAAEPLGAFDWLVITDDDVALPAHFLDRYLAAATAGDLVVSQPAHRFRSYTTYDLTRRRRGFVARQTGFVEIGPLTVIRREAFGELIPFPPSRWAYGIDVLWAKIARDHGWRMGVVDALPIGHLKPVGASYSMDEAIAEGRALLDRFDVHLNRADLFAERGELFPRG